MIVKYLIITLFSSTASIITTLVVLNVIINKLQKQSEKILFERKEK